MRIQLKEFTMREKDVYGVMKDRRWHTTIELKKAYDSLCYSADINDLRRRLQKWGKTISDARYVGLSNGRKVFRYRMQNL